MRCIVKNCFRLASFGEPKGERERCEIHRNERDVNPVDIVCEINKCFNKPTYGDGIRRYRCGSHKKNTDKKMGKLMDCVYYCTVQGCPYLRKFGINGDLLRCEKHKLEGDSARTKPRCVVEGCKSERVLYKAVGDKTNTHCKKHKQHGHISSKLTVCIEEGCFTSARFGNITDGVKLRCSIHKAFNDINLSDKTFCKEKDCTKDRTFGPPGKRKVRCDVHRIKGDVDNSPRCHKEFCDKIPTFGIEGGPKVHCFEHTVGGEINLLIPRCSKMGCSKKPIFGPMKWKRRRCIDHKKETDICAVGKRTISKEEDMEDSFFYKNLEDILFESIDDFDVDESFSNDCVDKNMLDIFEDIDNL